MKSRMGLFAIPAAVASMLPVLGCPLCWPGYAALLSSLGLGFLVSARYLLPLTIALLGVALAGLVVQARRQGSLVPLVLGSAASVAIVLGKFTLDAGAMTYAGVGLLLISSALSVLRTGEAPDACPGCATNQSARPASGR